MSLLDYIIRFWKLDEEFNFTPNEQALYMMVLRLANSGRWKSLDVALDNRTVMVKLRIGKAGMQDALKRLVAAGLVTYTPGNGRGKDSIYSILGSKRVSAQTTFIPVKVVPTVPLSVPKVPEPDHLSVPGAWVKGIVKVVWNGTLYSLEPSTGKAFRTPKSIDVLVGTIVPTVIKADAKEQPAGQDPPIKKQRSKKVTQESPCYTRCIDSYDKWVRVQTDGFGAKIDGVQGGAMKSIITYIRAQVATKAQLRKETLSTQEHDDRVVQTWEHVLDHTHLLGEWLKGQTRLVDFNTHFQNILVKVKNELSAKLRAQQATGTVQSAGRASAPNGRSGGTIAGLQNLKRNRGADPSERNPDTAP